MAQKRNYVILIRRDPERELWEQITAQYAASPKAAIDAVVDQIGPGSYRAVLASAWGREHPR